MSVLLLGLDDDLGPPLIRRLLAEDDIVGVVEEEPARAKQWKDLGAHVAPGSPRDADLVERAARHARSIVIVEALPGAAGGVVEAVLEAGRLVAEPPRIIFAGPPDDTREEQLERSAFDYVVLRIQGAHRRLRRRPKRPPAEAVAEAVNAADDLAGNPRVIADLLEPGGWTALGLPPVAPE